MVSISSTHSGQDSPPSSFSPSNFRCFSSCARVQGSGCRVQGAGCRVQGEGCRHPVLVPPPSTSRCFSSSIPVQRWGVRLQGEGVGFECHPAAVEQLRTNKAVEARVWPLLSGKGP